MTDVRRTKNQGVNVICETKAYRLFLPPTPTYVSAPRKEYGIDTYTNSHHVMTRSLLMSPRFEIHKRTEDGGKMVIEFFVCTYIYHRILFYTCTKKHKYDAIKWGKLFTRERKRGSFFFCFFLFFVVVVLQCFASYKVEGNWGKMNLNHENLFSLTHIRQSTLTITILFFHGVRSL